MKLLAFEQRHASIIARTIYPAGTHGGTIDDKDLGADIAGQLLVLPWWSALVMRLGLLVVWYLPLFRLRTFGSMSELARCEMLEKLARSHMYWLREMVLLVKMTVSFAAIGDSRTLKYIGAYDLAGGPVALKRKAS